METERGVKKGARVLLQGTRSTRRGGSSRGGQGEREREKGWIGIVKGRESE